MQDVHDSDKEEVKGSKLRNHGFLINHEFRDFYSEIQHAVRRLGDVGPESEAYKDHAYHQFAREPDNFMAPPTYGTIGREDNKNYNRMEYDEVVRHDGHAHKDDMATMAKKKPLTVAQVLKMINPKTKWTVNTTDTKVTDEPIIKKNKVNL